MEQALISASAILYEEEEYSDAFAYYEMLEKVTAIPEFRLTAIRGQPSGRLTRTEMHRRAFLSQTG